jgi:AcrR family transcriptional regulator
MILAMTEPGLRDRKKRETRQRLSDIASTLFYERGFDAVSVADVAEAAGVSKMTVFNYFPRKEDLFFDRRPESIELLTAAIRDRAAGLTPAAAIGALVLRLVDERHPLGGFDDRFVHFWKVVLDSAALRARAREAVEELEDGLTGLFADVGDPQAALSAALVVATMRICYLTGARRIMAGEHADDIFAEHRAFIVAAFARLDA